jgi:ribosomal protein S18 acetylase RimI-like enzyme
MGADVDVDVRIAGAADLRALVRLAGVFRDHLGRTTPLNADLGASIATLLKDPGTEFFLAGSGPAACGYVQCRYRYSAWSSAPEAELEDVFVVHQARRRGVGVRLVEFAISRAAAKGCRSIGLNTNERNVNALALYSRLGFRAERELWNGGRQLWLEKSIAT